MIIIPAIDIKNNHCVRLMQGKAENIKIKLKWQKTGKNEEQNYYILWIWMALFRVTLFIEKKKKK